MRFCGLQKGQHLLTMTEGCREVEVGIPIKKREKTVTWNYTRAMLQS